MRGALLACKQLSFNFDENAGMEAAGSGEPQIHTLIFDEKPGIQAIGTTTPDLPPTEENGSGEARLRVQAVRRARSPCRDRPFDGQGSSRL